MTPQQATAASVTKTVILIVLAAVVIAVIAVIVSPPEPRVTRAEQTTTPVTSAQPIVPPSVQTPAAEPAPTTTASTCGRTSGESQTDAERVKTFCAQMIPADLGVVSARGYETLLWIQVPKAVALGMKADRMSTEQIVKNWMRAWKQRTGSQAVTVYVQWQDVEVAKGDTTVFSGDTVTIR